MYINTYVYGCQASVSAVCWSCRSRFGAVYPMPWKPRFCNGLIDWLHLLLLWYSTRKVLYLVHPYHVIFVNGSHARPWNTLRPRVRVEFLALISSIWAFFRFTAGIAFCSPPNFWNQSTFVDKLASWMWRYKDKHKCLLASRSFLGWIKIKGTWASPLGPRDPWYFHANSH
jgi:hypothetical protein